MKKTSPQIKITLNDYITIIRKNNDEASITNMIKIMGDYADFNDVDVKTALSFLFDTNPIITITPGKSEFKIKGVTKIVDSFYDYNHYKSLVD